MTAAPLQSGVLQGTTKLGEATTAPYTFTWANVAGGKYTLQAKATNALSKISLSAPVAITINAAPITSFDITDNGGTITAQYPNTSKPTEDVPSLIDNTKFDKILPQWQKCIVCSVQNQRCQPLL